MKEQSKLVILFLPSNRGLLIMLRLRSTGYQWFLSFSAASLIPLAPLSVFGAESSRLDRFQHIDLEDTLNSVSYVAADNGLEAFYTLDKPSTFLYDLQIFRRVSLYGQQGYVADESTGPLACEFPNDTQPGAYSRLAVSPDRRWVALVYRQGAFFPEDWTDSIIRMYILDLEAPDRECSLTELLEIPAGLSAQPTFSHNSNYLYINLPYAGFPSENPVWNLSAGQLYQYEVNAAGEWTRQSTAGQLFDGQMNRNAGFATSFAVSDDDMVRAFFTPVRRIRESEDTRGITSQLGFLPEEATRNPSYYGISIVAAGTHHFFQLPVENINAYYKQELYSEREIGRLLDMSSDGSTVAFAYSDITPDSGTLRGIATYSLSQGVWSQSIQPLDLKSCIAPSGIGSSWAADLVLSDDGNRLAILAVGNGSNSAGVCLYSRSENQWIPLAATSQSISTQVQTMEYSNPNSRQLLANEDVSRLLIQFNSLLMQFDLTWEEEAEDLSGLPIWLLYEASRSDN